MLPLLLFVGGQVFDRRRFARSRVGDAFCYGIESRRRKKNPPRGFRQSGCLLRDWNMRRAELCAAEAEYAHQTSARPRQSGNPNRTNQSGRPKHAACNSRPENRKYAELESKVRDGL